MVASNWSATSAARRRRHEHVAAADVDLVGQRHGHRLAGHRLVEIAVAGDDARHPALAAGRQHADRSPGRTAPLAISPANPRKSWFGPVHPLHRQAERARRCEVSSISTLSSQPISGRPVVPGHVRRAGSAMLSPCSADIGMQVTSVSPMLRARTRGTPRRSRRTRCLRVVDQVHLVDRQHHVPDAEQRDEEAVAAGLGQHALARIDQDDGAGRRSTRR